MNSEHPSRYALNLAELGVSAELFSEATNFAASEARMCSDYDASSVPGTIFWSRANRHLAEVLTNRKMHDPPWKRTKRDHILRVIHPSGSHAITAISAHGGVANLDAKVRAKNPKGRVMAHLVESNAKFEAVGGQGVFYSSDDLEFGRELDEIPLWFLLYGKNKDGSLAAELSLPVKMNGKYVDEWSRRIPVFTNRPNPGIDVNLLDKPEETITSVDINFKAPGDEVEDA